MTTLRKAQHLIVRKLNTDLYLMQIRVPGLKYDLF